MSLRAYRKALEAESRAKELAAKAKDERKSTPHLVRQNFERRGYRWHAYECSECQHPLHRTARFCVECGAWFEPQIGGENGEVKRK